MEGQNEYDHSLELMLLNHGGNVNGDDRNQANALPLPPTFSDYYEFLTENSSLIQKAPTHVFDSISAPVSDPCFIQQPMSQFQTELLMYHNQGPALDMDAWKLNPHLYMFNSNNHQALSLLKCLEQYDEIDPQNKFSSSRDQTQTQSHSSLTQEASGATGNVSRSRPRRKVDASVFRQRVSSTDRKRREKIAERVKALQEELLPQSVEGSQSAVMDEIIEYVKYLQLQMKELSRTKLGVDFPSCPPIFNETMNEPVEETLAKLLKVDKCAAIKFLESKGLYVMPMDFADSLQ
ncbi:transcription factor LRL2-like isoform X2 [Euphorbia lathyris]|uniref:transcription factor LRL2-like isoform X2 n=1 Tax=Euphorbia lathyris TaxID=212925 RepID=UPI003314454A